MSWRIPGLLLSMGAKMLWNSLSEVSRIHFWSWGQKCFKIGSGGFLGVLLSLRQKCFKTASKRRRAPEPTFEPWARNALKQHFKGFLEFYFWACWGQKFFKTASWKLPGHTFQPGARNASKQPPGSFLEVFLTLMSEMLQNSLLQRSWSYFWAWRQTCFKTRSWRLPDSTFERGARNELKQL